MQNFKQLIKNISYAHNALQQQAVNSINQSLTIRNWLIGHYIVEYEQNGKDKAEYGAKLLPKLADELRNIKGLDVRTLHNFRLFYKFYPQVGVFLSNFEKMRSLTTIFNDQRNMRSLTTIFPLNKIRGSLTTKSDYYKNRVSGKHILTKLSYTHLEQLIRIEDDLKRTFYEIECIKGTWSVRELKRQISSLYFEARQKRILIGDKYYFIDLVFYHRILKCHVLVDLKIGEFEHGDIGQLNTYLNYFKQEISEITDNPPAGILLVADKDHALVKYATAGMDENLFVQQYLIQLPDKKQLEQYINNELKKFK